ncbi:hypothetical protein D3C84_844380 [compost metagenome]
MHTVAAGQLHTGKQVELIPSRIFLAQLGQGRFQAVNPFPGVVVGHGDALNVGIPIVLQPLARADALVAPVVQGGGRMVMKVELPPARAGVVVFAHASSSANSPPWPGAT